MSNKRPIIIVFLLVLIVLILTACSQTETSSEVDQPAAEAEEHINDEEDEHIDEGEDDHKDEGDSGEEHAEDEHEHIDPPAEYASLTNPFDGDNQAITAGMAVYETNCASCHGAQGFGDGPAAAALEPKPASLADAEMMDELSDGYLFWRVNEGGLFDPFNSVMPAWKNALSEDEIWQVLSYIRTFDNGN